MTEVPERVFQVFRALPLGWRLGKLKFFADVRNSNVDKTIHKDEQSVRLCNYTDVYYNDRITPDLPFMEGTATDTEIERFQLKRAQVIITKDSEEWDDIGIPALVTEDMPEVLCGYHLSVISPGPLIDGGFLAWLCRAEPLNDQFKLAANGVTRFGLGQYPMKNAFIAVPSLTRQRQISTYMDEKIDRIEGLIEKKRSLIDRLAEKRQALITRAVTKGLNPDEPMKSSNVDWLGDIPNGWTYRRLKFDVLLNPKKSSLDMKHDELVSHIPMEAVGEYGGLDLEDVRKLGDVYDGYTFFEDGDVCIAKITPCFENGKGALAEGLINGVGFGTTELHIVRASSCVDRRFLFYVTIADGFRKLGASEMHGAAGQKRVPESFIKDWMLPLPPLHTQQEIVRFLDEMTTRLDELIDKIKESQNLLEEYRSALITQAVTGQLAELC